jgi:peptidyl-prolyl cis-trans isomerase SurA
MVKRMGEKARLKHILVQPAVTSDEVASALMKLDSIKKEIEAGKISWQDAVTKFSTDERTKMSGGMFTNPSTGSSLLAQDELEPDVVLELGSLTTGKISSPKVHILDPKGEQKECRLIYLKNMSEPHIMDLNKDYNRIQQAALTEKQNNYLAKWVEGKIGEFYIHLDQDYATCNTIKKWLNAKEGKE